MGERYPVSGLLQTLAKFMRLRKSEFCGAIFGANRVCCDETDGIRPILFLEFPIHYRRNRPGTGGALRVHDRV